MFANGQRIGTGRLVVEDGEWAVRLEHLSVTAGQPARDDEDLPGAIAA